MRVTLYRRELVAADIVAFEFRPLGDQKLASFSAGSHIDVHLGKGLIRQYSLYNNSEESDVYRIAVLREPRSRGGSIAMHELKEGTEVEISEPRNHFRLNAAAKHTILMAGGIGITPIVCMAERLLHVGASFELHYCAREANRAAFQDRLGRSDIAKYVHLYFDDSPGQCGIDFPLILGSAAQDKHTYVCGPGGFIDAVVGTAQQNGWVEQNVHREYFRAEVMTGATNGSFQIKLARSGRTIEIKPEGSVLAALANAGVDVPVSCEQGVCGTCMTRVLDGEPDHRDVFMTDEEHAANDQFTPCCSRSKSRMLVLDL